MAILLIAADCYQDSFGFLHPHTSPPQYSPTAEDEAYLRAWAEVHMDCIRSAIAEKPRKGGNVTADDLVEKLSEVYYGGRHALCPSGVFVPIVWLSVSFAECFVTRGMIARILVGGENQCRKVN